MPLFAMKETVIAIFFVFFITSFFAQSKIDKAQFQKDSAAIMKTKLVRFQFRLDNRNFFFKGQTLNISGFDAGVLLKDKLRLTLGYYFLSNNLTAYEKTIDGVKYDRRLKLEYGSVNTEIIYKNLRYFSLGMPLEFCFGNNVLQYTNSESGIRESMKSGFICMADFGVSGTFKPIRWIGLKAILGYRKTLYNTVKDFRLDGLFTSIGLNIDVREIVKDFQMFRLKKKYKKGNAIENAVDLITD